MLKLRAGQYRPITAPRKPSSHSRSARKRRYVRSSLLVIVGLLANASARPRMSQIVMEAISAAAALNPGCPVNRQDVPAVWPGASRST